MILLTYAAWNIKNKLHFGEQQEGHVEYHGPVYLQNAIADEEESREFSWKVTGEEEKQMSFSKETQSTFL